MGLTPPKQTGTTGMSGSTGTPIEHRGDVDECSSCTAPLLLKVAGRTVCERCRIAAARAAS